MATFTLFILRTLLFHLSMYMCYCIGFDDSNIDEHTIGIKDFFLCQSSCVKSANNVKSLATRKKNQRISKHKF